MFPANVRALIIDGVLDPIAWTTGRGDEASTVPFSTRLRSDDGAQATLDEFFRLCDAGGPNCAFAPDSADRFAALGALLKSRPARVTFPDGSTGEVNYSDLIGVTLGALYDSLTWEDFAAALADLESQASAATLGVRLQPFRYPTTAYIPKRVFPTYTNALEGFPAVACADSDNPHSYAAWSAAGAAAEAAFGTFGRIWTWASSICAAWPTGDADRYTGPFTRTTANPVLVIGNVFDPATRYEGAVTASTLLPNSRLLTVHGWGHTSLFLSQCADEAQARYLVDLALPAVGTVLRAGPGAVHGLETQQVGRRHDLVQPLDHLRPVDLAAKRLAARQLERDHAGDPDEREPPGRAGGEPAHRVEHAQRRQQAQPAPHERADDPGGSPQEEPADDRPAEREQRRVGGPPPAGGEVGRHAGPHDRAGE
jgi:TAP-like protein